MSARRGQSTGRPHRCRDDTRHGPVTSSSRVEAPQLDGPIASDSRPATPEGEACGPREPRIGIQPLKWVHAVTTTRFPPFLAKDRKLALALVGPMVHRAPGSARKASTEADAWRFYASSNDLQTESGLGESAVGIGLKVLRTTGFLVLHARGGGITPRGRPRANEWLLSLPSVDLSDIYEGAWTPRQSKPFPRPEASTLTVPATEVPASGLPLTATGEPEGGLP